MSEFKITEGKFPEPKKVRKYEHILEMDARDPETEEGPIVEYPNTPANYGKLCSGVIPRYNKAFAPKHWVFCISHDKKSIMIQRTA